MPSLLKIYNIIYSINFLQNSVKLIKDEIVDEQVFLEEIKKEKKISKRLMLSPLK